MLSNPFFSEVDYVKLRFYCFPDAAKAPSVRK